MTVERSWWIELAAGKVLGATPCSLLFCLSSLGLLRTQYSSHDYRFILGIAQLANDLFGFQPLRGLLVLKMQRQLHASMRLLARVC